MVLPPSLEGLEAIGKGKHDICLVDYRLGSRDGLELITEAKARGCEAPIILLTGQHSRQIDLEAMNAGAADYLVKGDITEGLLARSIRDENRPPWRPHSSERRVG